MSDNMRQSDASIRSCADDENARESLRGGEAKATGSGEQASGRLSIFTAEYIIPALSLLLAMLPAMFGVFAHLVWGWR